MEGGAGAGGVQFVLRRGVWRSGVAAAESGAKQAGLGGGDQTLSLELLTKRADFLIGECGLSRLPGKRGALGEHLREQRADRDKEQQTGDDQNARKEGRGLGGIGGHVNGGFSQ